MGGERLDQAVVTQRGVLGDRAYALIDKATAKVVSAKSIKLFPDMFALKAAFVEAPKLDCDLPPVRISLPDGRSVSSDGGDVDDILSDYFGRSVVLAQTAPEDFTLDQYKPDLEGPDVEGAESAEDQSKFVTQKLGAALFAELGIESPVLAGAFFDVFPLSVLTSSTLATLSELRPQTRFDERRFRMNVTIRTGQAGFPENDWIGHQLALGDEVRAKVAMPDARCVMTTLAQDELPRDIEVLKTLARHNRIQVGERGRYPCAGVYAVVLTPGTIRVGDPATLG